MGKLLILFIIIPAIELGLLMEIGGRIGLIPTIAVIIFTGFLGAALARHQGLGILQDIQKEMATGRLPAGSMIDGVIVLVAGALLMTPGFLTDLFGFACLVPGTRAIMKRIVKSRIEGAVRNGAVNVHIGTIHR